MKEESGTSTDCSIHQHNWINQLHFGNDLDRCPHEYHSENSKESTDIAPASTDFLLVLKVYSGSTLPCPQP